GVACAQQNPHLPGCDEARQQAELNHWRFCRLLARASSESHSCHSHHATMICAEPGAYGARTRKALNHVSGQKSPLAYGNTRETNCPEIIFSCCNCRQSSALSLTRIDAKCRPRKNEKGGQKSYELAARKL